MISTIFGGHFEFMQIRRGCRGWKIGHPSFSDNLDPNKDENAKKSILANIAHRRPQGPTLFSAVYTTLTIAAPLWCTILGNVKLRKRHLHLATLFMSM